MLSPFQYVPTGVGPVDRALQKVREFLDNVFRVEFVRGQLLRNVVLSSGSNSVNHGLGRALLGYVVTRKNANVSVWDTQNTNANSKKTLALSASGAVTVDLWVF